MTLTDEELKTIIHYTERHDPYDRKMRTIRVYFESSFKLFPGIVIPTTSAKSFTFDLSHLETQHQLFKQRLDDAIAKRWEKVGIK